MRSAAGGTRRTAAPSVGPLLALLAALALAAAGCASSAAQPVVLAPSSTSTPLAMEDCPEGQTDIEICAPGTLTPSDTPLSQAGPSVTLSAEPAAPQSPTMTPPDVAPTPLTPTTSGAESMCQGESCRYAGLAFLQRPIDPSANDQIDLSYPFGSTQSGLRDPHHGVEFLNGFGTPVLAAADGVVVVAGTDIDPTSAHGVWPITFYGPYSNFYGSLVVIEHALPAALTQSFPELSGPLYTLYGHLSQIQVAAGQAVQTGQQIGQVGMAGIATGSHLHFEVRLGENSYARSRNPALWLAPPAGQPGEPLHGALAGAFFDRYGNRLELDSIVLQHLPEGAGWPSDFEISTRTYEEKGLLGLPPFEESFGVGDLPPGLYRITFPMGGLRQELIEITPGAVTVVTFREE